MSKKSSGINSTYVNSHKGTNSFTKLLMNKESGGNIFTSQELIPLGYKTYRNNYYGSNEIVSIKETFGSDNIVIVGTPGAGKTVIAKNIFYWESKFYNRTSIILDSLGQEWHLCRFPNSQPKGLFQKVINSRGEGIKNIESYTPFFANVEKNYGDIDYGLLPIDLDIRSWVTLGIERGEILSDVNKPEYGIDKLLDRIRQLPTSKYEAKNLGEEYFIHPMTYNKILERLNLLKNDNFFTNNLNDHLNKTFLMKKIMQNINLNFNFFDEKNYAKIYAGTILEHLYDLRLDKKIPPPSIFVEESDILCPNGDDTSPSARALVKAVRRGRKHGWSIKSITQRLSSLNSDVSDFFKTLIIGGNLTRNDLTRLRDMVTPEIVEAVKNLRFNPEKGIREFIVVRADRKHYETFRPHNCPVECFYEKREVFKI